MKIYTVTQLLLVHKDLHAINGISNEALQILVSTDPSELQT
jgi:hypothetical protein